MRFPAMVLVPADTQDIVATVTHLMDAYNVEREVAPRKEYVPQESIDYLVEVYSPFGLNADDAEAIAAELEEDTGFKCGHDEGGIWWMTTDNPRGEWDGWILHSLTDDVHPVNAMPGDSNAIAVVTPDGEWHDLGYRWDMSAEDKQALQMRLRAHLEQYPDHLAVLLDCHR